MKKNLFLTAIIATIGFYSCNKSGESIRKTVQDTITAKINADVLTAGIKVAYGTNVVDSVFPAASMDASAPVLDTPFTKVYQVFKGGYLTVYPHNLSGNVAGYYVQIVGAKSYFKVDYTKAIGLRRAAANGKNGARGYGDGFIDSAIVLKMPASIDSGIFYIKYAAYDTLNNVSNADTSLVIVLQEGSEVVNDSLIGTWRHMYTSCYSDGKYQCIWSLDTGYMLMSYYDCVDGLLVKNISATDVVIPHQIAHFDDRITFDKFGMTINYIGSYKILNLQASSCSNYIYDYQSNDTFVRKGTISYDAATRKLTQIYPSADHVGFGYSTYSLLELADSSFTIVLPSSATFKSVYKYIKQ
ncbi:hypothetical protein GO495_06035 [Chitinophaga oryziterrae]|uniref:Uncharacterized protein n=1 Tax=Chitinophaga oryziterrae TaxID=1031224 RepID=A0A6N8J5D3_9BACT|nr:hypothetical protein [Chitinophaga oryziterrae]MVT40134.1 hypothetical protein [Chitinophaga oryziterrae]